MDLNDPVNKFRLANEKKITKITIYSKENCIQCIMVKNFFNQRNIPYESVDITGNTELIDKILSYGYSSLPLVVLNDNFDNAWVGNNPDRLEEVAKEFK